MNNLTHAVLALVALSFLTSSCSAGSPVRGAGQGLSGVPVEAEMKTPVPVKEEAMEGTYDFAAAEARGSQVAVLAGGCFWCMEAVFEGQPGIRDVVSGYAGGGLARPGYEAVCTGLTGHAEVVAVEFDPALTSYSRILELFFRSHDPTSLNRQGADTGTQYRSALFPRTPLQEQQARKALEEAGKNRDRPIVTTLEPAGPFWLAEDYHQDYFAKHPDQAYCRLVIAPKLEHLGDLRLLPGTEN